MKRILIGAAGVAAAATMLLAPSAMADKTVTPAGTIYADGDAGGGYIIVDSGGSNGLPGALGQGYIGVGGDFNKNEGGVYGSCEKDAGRNQDGTSRRNLFIDANNPTGGTNGDASSCAG